MIKWTVLNIGCFSRNMFWGEDNSKSYRNAVCTSTFLSSDGLNIIVDPSYDESKMPAVLDARTGLKPNDINYIYITHAHSDHYMGLGCFPNAAVLVAPGELDAIKANLKDNVQMNSKIQPAPQEIIPGVELIPLPGHTMGLTGLIFSSNEGRVVVTGDAVMNRDFFKAAQGYYNSVDFIASTESIKRLYQVADIIVPGHDNYFITRAARM